MVGAFQKPSSGREPKPIHSIPYSVAQPLDRGYKNYYSIIQGNRQGFLSRSITRRSGKIAKQYYKKFCNFEGSLAKGQKGLFDKLTVRLSGRYISFLRNGLAKKLPSRRFRREEKCERLTIKSQARNAEERQKFRRFKRGIAKLTSFWTPT